MEGLFMKLKKFVKRMYKHKYGTGSTFYLIEGNIIDTSSYIEYRYDALANIHSLYLVELKPNTTDELHCGELPASLLINQNTRFILKDYVAPKYELSESDLR